MNTDKPILKELNQRKSVRAFLEKEIEPEKLDTLWEAARWAPSFSNKQDWRYYATIGQARKKFTDILNAGNHWALKAPLLLTVTRDISSESKTESREYGTYDVALSVMSLVIEAEHQGLRAHQMAGFKEKELIRVLKMPPQETPVVIIAIGYEGSTEDLDPITKEKEMRPRIRKSIKEIVKILPSI